MSTKFEVCPYILNEKKVLKIFINKFYFLGLLLAMFSCGQDEDKHHIDNELQSIFEDFRFEGSERNVEINFEALDVSGYLTSIGDRGVVGQCQSFENGNSKVLIDQDYWNRISDIKKEFLVFHELGHCVLGRSHNNETNLNGSCVSMMQSGDNVCRDTYTLETRDQYLDELFNN